MSQESGFFRLPDSARVLCNPWPDRSAEIPELTPELESDFRFGHQVFPFDSGYRIGGSIKGGSSTAWRPASAANLTAYRAWHRLEGIPEQEDPAARQALADLLQKFDISLGETPEANQDLGRGWIYKTILEVLTALPPEHLQTQEFASLQVGGWGPSAAKASAYDEGRVHLYDFALGGAARTMIGLLLHEMGHAHKASMNSSELEALIRSHHVIAGSRTLFGLEFLLDADSRKVYQQFLPEEFIAETYLAYTAAGPVLRRHIAALAGREAAAWQRTYQVFKDSFGGRQYC